VKPKRAYWAHASAVIDQGARVGAGTKIWHFCHVMKGAQVGAGCVLGQNVFVAAGAVLGDGCRVQNNVSIYDGVILGEEVFVGPSAVFTNVRTPRAAVRRTDEFELTRVRRGATIGANATIVCGVEIGEYALVGAGAVVSRDVAAHAVVTGVPAQRTAWACACGEVRRRLEEACAACGGRVRAAEGAGRMSLRQGGLGPAQPTRTLPSGKRHS
jgi:UDP-2-acetamido-3-amino-2,3-dideoxy-glucuronate N-acetyltransferase